MMYDKILHTIKLVIFIFSLIPFSLFCQPQDSNWIDLFNGVDLSGWQELNGNHKWEVIDGMIVGTTVPGEPNGFLVTENEYGDFVLELEVSIDTLMNNSGIQFRSLSYPGYKNGRVHGYQMEVDPKPQKWSGAIYWEGGNRGWLYTGEELSCTAKEAFIRDSKENFSWNKYRIEAVGSTIRTWINDVPAAHLIDDRILRGFIGLQLHANQENDPEGSYKVRFRNLRIKTGSFFSSPYDSIHVSNFLPNNLSTQEELNGYSLLWDGRSTNGWKGRNDSKFPEIGWNIKNGVLTIVESATDSNDSLSIFSEESYGLFDLKFDFKIKKGGNSSISYFVTDFTDTNNFNNGSIFNYQIIDDINFNVPVNQKIGSLTNIIASSISPFYLKELGKWNRGNIKMMAKDHIEYWLNGYKVLDFKFGSEEFKNMILEENFHVNPLGHIVIRNEGSEVSFRSIKIRKISEL